MIDEPPVKPPRCQTRVRLCRRNQIGVCRRGRSSGDFVPTAESRDSNADRSVDIFPVTKELLIRQTRLLGDAINEFDHDHLLDCAMIFL